MALIFFKRLNQRTKNIIGTILSIVIITWTVSLVMLIVFGAIGKLAKLSFMTSLGRVCLFTFMIALGVMMPIAIILLICFIIDEIKRDGLKKLLKRLLKTLTPLFIIVLVINFFKHKKLEWIDSLFYSLTITLIMFFKTEIDIFNEKREQEYSLNASSDKSDSTSNQINFLYQTYDLL